VAGGDVSPATVARVRVVHKRKVSEQAAIDCVMGNSSCAKHAGSLPATRHIGISASLSSSETGDMSAGSAMMVV
jgi:hypothetical protein